MTPGWPRSILIIVLLSLLGGCQNQAGEHRLWTSDSKVVDWAYFRPDRPFPDHAWTEGWSFEEQFFPEHVLWSGSFHIYLSNPYDRDLEITGASLNGRRLEELQQDLTVVWWRTLPNPIRPGRTAEVIVRLKGAPPSADTAFVFQTKDHGPIQCTVRSHAPGIEIGYVAFSPAIDSLYVYVQKNAEGRIALSQVHLDGADVTGRAEFYPRDGTFHRGLCLVRISLSDPLRYGSYHLVKVISADGKATASMVRAWDGFYSIGMFYGSPDRQVMLDQKRHLINTAVGLELPLAEELGLKAVNHNFSNMMIIREEDFATSIRQRASRVTDRPGLLAHLLFDEPDVQDAYRDDADGTGRALGYWAMPMEQAAKVHREVDPNHPTLLVVDNTYKPSNWYLYGQIADIFSTDPYATADCINPATLFYVAQSTETAYAACAPKPLIVILQAFYNLRAGFHRMPDRIEERIMAYYAVGCGAKGIHYFWYPSKPGHLFGCRGTPLWEEIGRINAELEVASPLLSVGHPVRGVVASSTPGLWTRSLLCGEDSLVVTLVNHTYRYEDWTSKEGKYQIKLLENVVIQVALPPWMKAADVFAVTDQGPKRLAYAVKDDKVTVNAGDVDSGQMIVVTQDDKLFEARSADYRTRIRPLQNAAGQ